MSPILYCDTVTGALLSRTWRQNGLGSYEGEWQNSWFHGQGTFRFSNGQVFQVSLALHSKAPTLRLPMPSTLESLTGWAACQGAFDCGCPVSGAMTYANGTALHVEFGGRQVGLNDSVGCCFADVSSLPSEPKPA